MASRGDFFVDSFYEQLKAANLLRNFLPGFFATMRDFAVLESTRLKLKSCLSLAIYRLYIDSLESSLISDILYKSLWRATNHGKIFLTLNQISFSRILH